MDDFGVGGYNDSDNIATLSKLFTHMATINYKLGADKILLGYLEALFLGFLLKDGHIAPDPNKAQAIAELLPPTTRTQLRAFLGISGYYRIFI